MKPPAAQQLLTEEQAIELARKAIAGHVSLSADSTLEVEQREGRFVIEWRRHQPPGTRGPDYDARVTVDRASGEVVEFLVGS